MGVSNSLRGWRWAVLMPTLALATACGDGSEPTTRRSSDTTLTPSTSTLANTPTPSTSTLATTPTTTEMTVATVAPTAVTSIDPQAPLTQTVAPAFDPPFTLLIPADWTAVLRDIWAFQAYAGNEDFEITFDHTYRAKESVDDAISRLSGTTGLTPGEVTPVVVGGLEGKGFVGESQSAVRFLDSGFHTNGASRLEVIAVPMPDGTTVTVFLTAGADPQLGVDALGPLARRIFDTVQWK